MLAIELVAKTELLAIFELIVAIEELIAGCEVTATDEELDASTELIRATEEPTCTELDEAATAVSGPVGLVESLQATRVSTIADATKAETKYFCFIPTFLLKVKYDDRI